jgi:hypothetical protein
LLILRDITHKRLRDQKIKAVSLLNAHPSGIIVMADAQDPQNVQIVLLADVPNQQQPEIGEQQHVAAEPAPPVQADAQPQGQAPPVQVCSFWAII